MSDDSSKTLTLKDLDSVTDLLESIAGIFEAYYNIVPKTDDLTKEKEIVEE